MNILFRYDDFSELSNISLDLEVLETLVICGFKPLVGVIPAIAEINWELGNSIPLKRLSKERINLLKPFLPNNMDIALHGYTHQTITRYTGLSEFGDAVNFDRQVERMMNGKKFLEDSFGIKVNWFIPPWNSYGLSTLKAMKGCRIKGLSGDASDGQTIEGITYAPNSCQLNNLNIAIANVKNNPNGNIIVMLHDYNFKESGNINSTISIPDFKKTLLKLSDLGIKGTSFSELLNQEAWNSSRAILNQELHKIAIGPLRILMKWRNSGIYYDEKTANKKLALFKFYKYYLSTLNLKK